MSTKTSTKLTHKKEPVNLADQPALFLSYDRNFLRAASPLYKSLRGWRGGVWGGEEEALLQKGAPPSPEKSNYGKSAPMAVIEKVTCVTPRIERS